MRRNWFLLMFALLPAGLVAQLFSPPQPYMYRATASLESPPAGTRHVRISRYIPGSRFPTSWDMMIEERHYDEKGHLTNWKRYDSFSGALISEKKIRWTAQGDREEERTWRIETRREDVLKFANQYDAQGKFQSAALTDGTGKACGSIKLLPHGGRETTILPAGAGLRLIFEHDAQGRLLRSLDEQMHSEDRYRYDGSGELVEIERIRNGKSSTLKYRNTLDKSGKVTQQEEVLPEGIRLMFFEYDDKGQLLARKWEPSKPAEGYHYAQRGQLADVMQYTLDGYPKEVFAYFTEFYP